MATVQAPPIPLNSGHSIPQLGFGVFQVEAGDAQRAVSEALEAGYRHIDTAKIYGNEAEVGRALAASGIPREELFVTTKLSRHDVGYENARAELPRSLERLALEYVDLYLLHWPVPWLDVYVESWWGLEEHHEAGLARSIGVCNFQPEHLERLLAEGEVVPAVNQIELHPAFQQRDVRAFHEPKGVVTQAWGPLAQGAYPLDELPGVADIAQRHGKTAAQVVLRWHVQEGRVVFPKTVRPARMRENAAIFDFALEDDEMRTMAALDRGQRIGPHPNDRR